MKLVVHRGTNEIGATCIDLQGGGARIMVDAGLPLDDSPAALPGDVADVDGLFLSHAHPDHFGLLPGVPQAVPVHAGELTWRLVQDRELFLGEAPVDRPFIPLTPDSAVQLGKMTVTPLLMDHSAPEAFGFLVEADGRRVFCTGDFRAHGRKAGLFRRLLNHPPGRLDALLIEGTMLGRPGPAFLDEDAVEESLCGALKREPGPGFIVCPGQNVDRLVSAYKAAVRAERSLVVDLYTAWILERMRLVSRRTPAMDWPRVRVLAHGWPAARQYAIIKGHPERFGDFLRRVYRDGTHIDLEELGTSPGDYFIKASLASVRRMLGELRPASAAVFYSMWRGYLDPSRSPRDAAIMDELKGRGTVSVEHVHTGGHAGLADLRALVDALQPERIIPVHTEHKQEYCELFENVHVLDDGEAMDL